MPGFRSRGSGGWADWYHTIKGGRTIIFAGGLPLLRNGVLVGGVGVSGGDSAQDARIVAAAAAAFC